MARKIPVHMASSNVVCIISSPQEISLAAANHAAILFVDKLKAKYGENVLPHDSAESFCFDVLVDETGEVISQLPSLDQIQKTKGHWSEKFKIFLRHRQ